VLCAYLRMPTAPGQPPDEASPSPTRPPTPPADSTPADDPAELSLAATEDGGERQVRLTAQRILTDHLKPGPNPQPAGTFWQDIDLDLTGATLIDLDLSRCSLRNATFNDARFAGGAWFDGAQFAGIAWFLGAQFAGDAGFDNAQFSGDAGFDSAQFAGGAGFDGAQFAGDAGFDGAQFFGDAGFDGARFAG